MDATAVERLHCAFGCARVVKFHEAVVETLVVELRSHISVDCLWGHVSIKSGATGTWPGATGGGGKTYTNVLVRNDLDTLDMAGGLKDLTQDILGDPGVQAAHVQGSLVGLGGSATGDVAGASAGGRHDVCAHGRADGGGDGVRVLGNDDRRERWGRHVLLGLAGSAAIVAGGACRGRGGRHLSLRGGSVGHGACRV